MTSAGHHLDNVTLQGWCRCSAASIVECAKDWHTQAAGSIRHSWAADSATRLQVLCHFNTEYRWKNSGRSVHDQK